MKKIKNVFLSAIYKDAGKTTIAVGLYKILKERKLKAAFMKPVGQQYVVVNRQNVDKDSYLMGEIYHCWKNFKEMSPVTVGRGFTEQYIFNPNKNILRDEIIKSFMNLTRNKDVMIVEGTGHAGVGSVFDFSNADVASLLGSKVIIISEGGIGRTIDEICLNKALFDLKGVEILGVIVNKVLPEKYKKIKRSVAQGLKNKNIRLLGVIPLDPILTFPTVEQLMDDLDLKLLCGKENLSNHVENTIVAAMEPHNMITYLKSGTLVITSGDREDNILVSVTTHLMSEKKKFRIAGMILTGGLLPHPRIVDLLKKSKIPVLLSGSDTYKVAASVENSTCKIEKTDKDKIAEASWLVKKYVDVDTILKIFNLMNNPSKIFIIDGARTAIGGTFKALKDFTAAQLASLVIKDLVKKNKIPKELIGHIILGNTVSAGTGQNMARQAAVLSAMPSIIPAFSVNSVCGSGLQSVISGVQTIICTEAEIVVAGGAESASQSPYVIRRDDQGKNNPIDSLIFDGLICQLTGKHMGDLAESLAKKFDVSRLDQDKYALESHIRACRAKEAGKFSEEIVPVEVKGEVFEEDQKPRKNLSLERLANLPSAFKKEGTVTAGNSSVPSDGAAVLLLASEEAVKKLKIKPKARILGYSSVFVEPDMVFTAAIPSVKACLKKCNLLLKDIDLFEMGEAFAAQAIVTQKELNIPANKMNIFGGDVALGHPLGAAGSRILVTLLSALNDQKKKLGLASICLGGGGGISVIIEVLK